MKNTINKSIIISALAAESARAASAWKRGVTEYASDLLESVEGDTLPTQPGKLERLLLNGASNWHDYSWGVVRLFTTIPSPAVYAHQAK